MRCLADIVGGPDDGSLITIDEHVPVLCRVEMDEPMRIELFEGVGATLIEVTEVQYIRDEYPKGEVGDIVIFAYRLRQYGDQDN